MAQRGEKIVRWMRSREAATVAVGVGVDGHPLSAALTAPTSSLIATTPSLFRSQAAQRTSPTSALLTPRMSSLTATAPSPSQSPAQAATKAVMVGVGDAVGVGAPGV